PGAEDVGVGEQDLGGHPFPVEDGVPHGWVERSFQLVITGLGVPLLDEVGVDHAPCVERRLVLVELLAEGGVQVLAVDGGRRSGMPVGGDDEVLGHEAPRSWTSVGFSLRSTVSSRVRSVDAWRPSGSSMITNRPSRMPSTTIRASSSSGWTGMPFSRKSATVIAGVVRGRSLARSA